MGEGWHREHFKTRLVMVWKDLFSKSFFLKNAQSARANCLTHPPDPHPPKPFQLLDFSKNSAFIPLPLIVHRPSRIMYSMKFILVLLALIVLVAAKKTSLRSKVNTIDMRNKVTLL